MKTKRLVTTAMLIAIATVLSVFQPFQLPFGGGITIASMMPIVIIAFCYGTKWGLFSAFIFSLLQMFLGAKTITAFFLPGDSQMALGAALIVCFLDYIAAYTVLGFGGILNCILDPIFIFGYFGLPQMGVAGASLATAISKWVSFAILILPYLTRRSMLHLSIRNFKICKDIIGNIVSVGSSSMFRSGLAVVAAIMLNDLAGNISDSVLAGIGVVTKVMMFPFSIILGFGSGFQPVAGFNWGAQRYDRVKESYRFSAKVALIGATLMAITVAVLADTIIVLFAGTDPEMRRIGVVCMVSQCIALPIHAWVAVVNMLCAGLGNAKGALALSTARQGTCFIPTLYLLTWMFRAYGVAIVQAVADVLTLALAIPILINMQKKIRQAEEKMPVRSLV